MLLTLIWCVVFKLARRGSTVSAIEMAAATRRRARLTTTSTKDRESTGRAGRLAETGNGGLNALKMPAVTKKAEVLTKHIGDQAKKDSTAMAHVCDPG